MKIDGFLKVPDIPGPSERSGHEEEIEIRGVKFGMRAPFDPNSLSRRGLVALDMIVFTKNYDMSSPYLKLALFNNTSFDEVTFSAWKTLEGEAKDYLVITLTKASVMSYDVVQSLTEPDLLEEQVAFAYHAIKFVYDSDHEAEMSVRTGV